MIRSPDNAIGQLAGGRDRRDGVRIDQTQQGVGTTPRTAVDIGRRDCEVECAQQNGRTGEGTGDRVYHQPGRQSSTRDRKLVWRSAATGSQRCGIGETGLGRRQIGWSQGDRHTHERRADTG